VTFFGPSWIAQWNDRLQEEQQLKQYVAKGVALGIRTSQALDACYWKTGNVSILKLTQRSGIVRATKFLPGILHRLAPSIPAKSAMRQTRSLYATSHFFRPV
jgi:hypothetical protein